MDVQQNVECLKPHCRYRLTDAVTAFAFFTDNLGIERYGPVCELPEGANLEICGAGFNQRTVKARYGNCYYHVFSRDLAPAVCIDQAIDSEDPAGAYFAATA
jgi:hypothetical protein